jgi:hypothetical protein
MAPNENGWGEYKRLILSEIHDIKEAVEDVRLDQIKLLVEVERLKIKASLWGAAAGAIPVFCYILLKEFTK